MAHRRIIVATSPAHLGDGFAQAPQLVGIMAWRSPERWNTILVKSRYPASRELTRPEALLARPAQAFPLQRPVDFIPMKPDVDVALLGHAELPGRPGEPVDTMATFLVGEQPSELVLRADGPGRIPLAPPYLRVAQSGDASSQVAPRETPDSAEHDFDHPADFPYENYQCANRYLMRAQVKESTKVSLSISGKALLELDVPPRSPRVLLDPTDPGPLVIVDMDLDTIVVDFDRSELELTWRGMVHTLNGLADVERLIVGWSSDAEMADPDKGWDAILRELPHGTFEHAWELTDAEAGQAPPPLESDDLMQARLVSWSHPHPPAPRMELERFSTIQAELAEGREPRADTLARHDTDEYRFGLEERAWLDRIAAEGRTGGADPPIAKQYAQAVVLASDKLAAPGEQNRSLRSYAELLVRMERSDASKALKEAGVSLGAWIRWDRQVTQRQEREPEVAAELRWLIKELRGTSDERAPGTPEGRA